jgi:outer membrane protein assembly factor BamB
VNGTAIFGGCDGYLHVVDINTGLVSAKINVATYVPGSAPTDAGLAYVGDYDGGFSCVSITEKKIAWKYSNDKVQLPFVASAAISGDRVITGSRDKNVYCFGKTDGKLIWKYNTGEKVDASPLICQDKVLVANMRGDLILVKLSDGTPVWTFETGTPIFGNPAVSGGMIYVGGQDGTVQCFGK